MLISCGSSDDSPSGAGSENSESGISYTDINSITGFSAAYLNNKTFYRPDNYQSNYLLNDDLFANNGSASFSIVSNNGIDGILEYNDCVYDLYYNVHSVEADHIKVCYTYTGIDTVISCDVAQAYKWYFDRAIAENNFP